MKNLILQKHLKIFQIYTQNSLKVKRKAQKDQEFSITWIELILKCQHIHSLFQDRLKIMKESTVYKFKTIKTRIKVMLRIDKKGIILKNT